MSVLVKDVISREKANKKLKLVGNNFAGAFLESCPEGLTLRSTEPGVCWKAGGQLMYFTTQEYCGPNTSVAPSPLIFRLQVNTFVPVALNYHKECKAAMRKLGFVRDAIIVATEPKLQLYAMPDELLSLRSWLPEWLSGQFYRNAEPPTPPINLIYNTWDETGRTKNLVFSEMVGKYWRAAESLWTDEAYGEFVDYLCSLDH